MTELLEEINTVQEPCKPLKPYLGFVNLKIGYYKIEKFRLVTNKYFDVQRVDSGPEKTLLVELEDQVLFMPGRISMIFRGKEQKIDVLNNLETPCFLFYGGTHNRFHHIKIIPSSEVPIDQHHHYVKGNGLSEELSEFISQQ